MTAAFIFCQDVYLSFEFRVRMNRARFCKYLATFDFFTVNTTEQRADVVASFSEVKQFTEHFYARYDGVLRFVSQANDFYCVAYFNRTTFNTACSNRTTACDREYVFDWHQERFVRRAIRCRDVVINSIHEVEDGLFSFFVAFEGFQGRTYDDRYFVARIIIGAQEVTNFHFYEFD